jgi:hypothetical protein
MIDIPSTGIKPSLDAAAPREEAGDGRPCPVCLRGYECKMRGHLVACAWLDNGQGRPIRLRDGSRATLYDLRRFRHAPAVGVALGLLKRHFFNRTDVVAFKPPWDSSACPAVGGEQLDGLLRAHLTGAHTVRVRWRSRKNPGGSLTHPRSCWRIGTYGPAPDGTTRWAVIDFDGGGDHSAPLADPTAVALSVRRRCLSLLIPAYLERSKGGKGWHLWVFFEPTVPAALAREFAFAVLPRDAPLTDGTLADASRGRGLEVFPKRADLADRLVGAQVWLPWYAEAGRGGNTFYFPADDRGLTAFIPDEFKTVDEARLRSALATRTAKRS